MGRNTNKKSFDREDAQNRKFEERKDQRASETDRGSKTPRSKNNGSKGRGRSSRSQREPRGDRNKLPVSNPFEWYSRYPELLAATASVPYPNKPGMVVELATGSGDITLSGYYNIPGVMRIDWVPMLGYSETATDPISRIGTEMYDKVRNAFSGTLRADAPDYVMYIMALDSIYSYIENLKRIYGLVNSYTPDNYLVPYTVLNSLGVSQSLFNNLRTYKDRLYGGINDLIHQLDKFVCPAVFYVIDRHRWLNTRVYSDTESLQGQLFVFQQKTLYKFANVQTPQAVEAGGLVPVSLAYGSSVASMLTLGQSLIDALSSWDDVYTINGYLTRAFQDAPRFTMELMPYPYKTEIVYDETVLQQIENLRVIDTDSPTVSQNPMTNAVISKPIAAAGTGVLAQVSFNPMLNIHSNTPTIIDTVEATRLQATVMSDNSVSCGTEAVVGLTIYVDDAAKGVTRSYSIGQITAVPKDASVVNLQSEMYAMTLMSTWKRHPLLFQVHQSTTGDYVVRVMGNIWNIAVLRQTELKDIHRICLMSKLKHRRGKRNS